ncbi:hypothetical protein MD484_g6849, partial [Candolleomyces efflorescens]
MSQPPPKKHGLWCRTTSVFRRRAGGSTDPPQGPANVNLHGGTSDSDHASTSAPTLLHPTSASNLQGHEREFAIPQSQSASDLTEYLHLSSSTGQASPHHHHIPSAPSQLPHHYPLASGSHGGLTPSARGQSEPSGSKHRPTHAPSHFPSQSTSVSQFLVPSPPRRPSRSEDHLVGSSHPDGLSAPHGGDLSRQHSYQSLPPAPPPQLYDHTTVPRTPEAATSFLAGAHGFNMRDMFVHYHEAPQMPSDRGGQVGVSSIDGWELLIKKTAPSALHNSSARFDAPKCDEDTRVEVTNELMEWIQDRSAPQRLLCMTGAAGSGKSCLQQTAAEKCVKYDILAASYFISSTDPTRNTVETVIPTIAYQLGRKNRNLKSLIKATIEEDPLIFNQSLEAQTMALVVEPFQHMKRTGVNLHDLPP